MPISRIVFAGRNASGNANLGVTPRTSAGTSVLTVARANAGGLFNSSNFRSGFSPGFTVLGNLALFEGDDATGAASLWVTDGTSAGTSELTVAGSDAGGLFTNVIAPHLTVFAGKALFVGEDANGTISLWATDGTGPAPANWRPREATPAGCFSTSLRLILPSSAARCCSKARTRPVMPTFG
jgi:ELWxxDGT repeat protein